MNDSHIYFITWTTYGTWLPGDGRGWRQTGRGEREPQPLLEDWCRRKMNENPVLLTPVQRNKIELICFEHVKIRNWHIHAIAVRSNHVHIVVTADAEPTKVRDQFKANSTRVLRQPPEALNREKVWTRGGDCSNVDNEDDLEKIVLYVTEAQDRMGDDQ